MSGSNKLAAADYRLKNLNNALYVDGEDNIVMRTGFVGNIVISGNVNVPGIINVQSSPEDPVDTHIRQVGTSGILNVPYLPVFVNNFPTSTTITSGNLSIYSLPAVAQSGVWYANINNFPTSTTITSGNVSIFGNVEIKNDVGNPIPISGNVTATIADVITVVVNEDAGTNYAFNNHSTNSHRGWTMDDTMRPVVTIRVTDSGTSLADLIKIIEYEIGNNNANQSTIVYEWYEGALTISGASIPSWTNLGTKIQYRVYQDVYSSNQSNTFTTNGAALRHSGIIIGKNTQGDEGPANLYGGATQNMLTLCMKRVDNGTKLDVWFAFTIKELA
jgi:hypothetical protein